MTVSVITISFNQGLYLPLCVRSVLSQLNDDDEYVVVDAGSVDGSRQTLEELNQEAPNMTLIFEGDRGPADGLNKAFELATKEILIYINADDELAPGAIEAVRAFHRACPTVDVGLGAGYIIGADGAPLKPIRSDRKLTSGRYAAGVGTLLQQGSSYRRRVFDHVQFNIDNRLSWDMEFVLDAVGRGFTCKRHDSVVGYFRTQPHSITHSGQYGQRLEQEYRRLIAKYIPSPISRALLRLSSPFCRVVKRASTELYRRRLQPDHFPGHAI